MLTTKLLIRTGQFNIDKTQTIKLRVTYQRVTKFYSLHINVFSKDWDCDNCIVKKSDELYLRKNLLLSKVKTKVQNIHDYFDFKDKRISLERFEQLFYSDYQETKNFFEFVENQIQLLTDKLEPITFEGWRNECAKLKKFQAKINLNDIDLIFLHKYESYLKKLGQKENTIIKSLKFLKSILNKAIRHEIINDNPFKNYPISNMKSNPKFLTLDEVYKLHGFYEQNIYPENLHRVLEYFLVGCFTGLSYPEMRLLKFSNIEKSYFGGECIEVIRITRHKTKEELSIPLNETVQKIIQKRRDSVILENQPIFQTYDIHTTNKHLRRILDMAGIQSNLSWHKVRNTLVINLLLKGQDLKTSGAILGHTSTKTTEIYSKMVDELKFNALRKLDR